MDKYKPQNVNRHSVGDVLFGLFLFLFFRLEAWLCSVPMWATLILHFVIGLSIKWFWATLVVWLLVGVAWYLVLLFARWGAGTAPTVNEKENKNPYSHRENRD